MIIEAFLQVLLPIIVAVGCGYALRRAMPIELQPLNRLSMYVLSPALIFTTLVGLEVSGGQALRIAAVSILVITIMGVITYMAGGAARLGRAEMSGLLLCTMFMNAGNYGLSAANFAFGEAGLERALLFFIPQTLLSQVLAIAIASSGNGATWRASLRQVLRMPQIYAALAGLAAHMLGVRPSGGPPALDALLRGVALIANATLPLLLLLLGMQLAQGVALEDQRLTGLAVTLRLLVSPLVGFGLAMLLGLDDPAWRVVTLQAAMPAAVNMSLYAFEFNARPRFVAGVVALTTLLSPLSLALLLGVLRA
jgi:predicted permease